MSRNHAHFPAKDLQQGAALFISLVILLILAMIGASAIQTVSLQERMAANLKDQTLAFAAAESALREAEGHLAAVRQAGSNRDGTRNLVSGNNPDSTEAKKGVYNALVWDKDNPISGDSTEKKPWWVLVDESFWRGTDSRIYTLGDKLPNKEQGGSLSENDEPRYVIELIDRDVSDMSRSSFDAYDSPPIRYQDLYRITARSPGGSDETLRYLQTFFGWVYIQRR